MIYLEHELKEKSDYILSKIRERHPDFPDLDLSNMDKLNEFVTWFRKARDEAIRIRDLSFEDKKKEMIIAWDISWYIDELWNAIMTDKSINAYSKISDAIWVSEKDLPGYAYDDMSLNWIYKDGQREFDALIKARRTSDWNIQFMSFESFALPYAQKYATELDIEFIEPYDLTLSAYKEKLRILRSEAWNLVEKATMEFNVKESWKEWCKIKFKDDLSLDDSVFWNDYVYKRLLKKNSWYIKANKKLSDINSLLSNIASFNSRIEKLKSSYEKFNIKGVATLSHYKWEFGSVDDLIRHNHSVLTWFTTWKKRYTYRLYSYSALSWDGVEYASWVEYATSESELAEILSKTHNTKVVLKWLKTNSTPEHKKLWIKSHEDMDNHVKRNLSRDICVNCGKTFRLCDWHFKYFTEGEYCDFCSEECRNIYENWVDTTTNSDWHCYYIDSNHKPVIYRIHNKVTKNSYIGKTEQVFTLRWYQHFYQWDLFAPDTKLYGLESWQFDILETIDISNNDIVMMSNISDDEKKSIIEEWKTSSIRKLRDDYIFRREQYYIDLYDTKNNWYNRRDNFSKK